MATLQDIVSDDLNYEVWAPILKDKLLEKGLWDVVENGIQPDPYKIPKLGATIQAEDLSNSKWRDFVGKDKKALQILRSSLPDSVVRKTRKTASAKGLWDLLKQSNEQAKLEKAFERVGIEEEKLAMLGFTKTVISLSDQYYGTATHTAQAQNLTFNNLREVLDTLESEPLEVGSSSDDQITNQNLISLSDSYYGTGTAPVVHKGKLNLTFKKFREELHLFESAPVETINEFLRGLEVGSSSPSQEDGSSMTREGEFKRGKGVPFGGRGHSSRVSSNKNQSQRPSRQFETDIQSKNEVLPEYQMLAVDIAGLTFDEDMWMIYMTTSNHMTPYEKYFTTLDRTHKARVKFMFGDPIMSEGMGDVMIMHKGKKITIKNVLFVPGINRNVLSVGQMTERGYGIVMSAHKCTIEDETGRLFGETMWEERGFFLRLKVIEGNLTS